MTTTKLETDYLIIGAGAMGMAFADVVLTEDPAARIVMVDRHANPGGHWNDAYPFVRLHQPAAFYGLNSARLGRGGEDLVCGPEIVAYFRSAMDRFLATGRLRYLPMSDYRGDGRIVSAVEEDRAFEVTAHRRIVDSTYMKVEVPSVVAPRYTVDPEVTLVPPNGLPLLKRPYERYVVLGAGKTGIDAILFLLDQGVSPHRIQWIVSNDAWLWARSTVQPGGVLKTVTAFVESIVEAGDVDDIYLRLERRGIVARIDTTTLPTKWRCATVSDEELTGLRRIEHVIRLGRVRRVSSDNIELDNGTVEVVADSLFVDCTANGLAKSTPLPVFAPGRLVLQSVFMCQQTFSAAVIAHLELLGLSDEKRNDICAPVPHPELKEHLLACLITTNRNMIKWNRHMPLWLRRSRLNLGHEESPHHYLKAAAKMALLHRKAVASMNRLTPREWQTGL